MLMVSLCLTCLFNVVLSRIFFSVKHFMIPECEKHYIHGVLCKNSGATPHFCIFWEENRKYV